MILKLVVKLLDEQDRVVESRGMHVEAGRDSVSLMKRIDDALGQRAEDE